MTRPYPKPIKKEKEKPKGCWIGGRYVQAFEVQKPKSSKKVKTAQRPVQRYRASTGKLYAQSQIDTRLSKSYGDNPKPEDSHCECCHEARAVDHDHTISQRRCKILKLTEFIWSVFNWSLSCRKCHGTWEGYKSGKFQNHRNVVKRMLYLKKHDVEGFNKRMLYITNKEVIKSIENGKVEI